MVEDNDEDEVEEALFAFLDRHVWENVQAL